MKLGDMSDVVYAQVLGSYPGDEIIGMSAKQMREQAMNDVNGLDIENFGANQTVKDHLEKRQFRSFEVILKCKMEMNNSTGQNMMRFYAVKLLPTNYKEEA